MQLQWGLKTDFLNIYSTTYPSLQALYLTLCLLVAINTGVISDSAAP